MTPSKERIEFSCKLISLLFCFVFFILFISVFAIIRFRCFQVSSPFDVGIKVKNSSPMHNIRGKYYNVIFPPSLSCLSTCGFSCSPSDPLTFPFNSLDTDRSYNNTTFAHGAPKEYHCGARGAVELFVTFIVRTTVP